VAEIARVGLGKRPASSNAKTSTASATC
jgi:hypothetical protein